VAIAGRVRYRYLLGAMQQAAITTTVRLLGTPEESQRLPQIVETWRAASARMRELLDAEAGAADRTILEDPPAIVDAPLAEIQADPLFQASFSDLPTTIRVVEIDNIVAPQRDVNLDYVDTLRERLTDKSMTGLVEFCLATRAEAPGDENDSERPESDDLQQPESGSEVSGRFPKGVDGG
jgi:hypothetical protein